MERLLFVELLRVNMGQSILNIGCVIICIGRFVIMKSIFFFFNRVAFNKRTNFYFILFYLPFFPFTTLTFGNTPDKTEFWLLLA